MRGRVVGKNGTYLIVVPRDLFRNEALKKTFLLIIIIIIIKRNKIKYEVIHPIYCPNHVDHNPRMGVVTDDGLMGWVGWMDDCHPTREK